MHTHVGFARRARIFLPLALFALAFMAAGDLPARALGRLLPAAMVSPLFSPIAFEAESMTLTSPMLVGTNSAASNGAFISTTIGGVDPNCALPSPGGVASRTFTISTPGTYRIWARSQALSSNQDSMCAYLDQGTGVNWTLPTDIEGSWRWSVVGNFNAVQLAAGVHTLRFRSRELNAKVDRVIITNDLSYVPTGLGILPTYSPVATPTPLASPTRTPAPTLTRTPGFSATLTPAPTATRTPAVTFTPTAPPTGPIVIEAESGQIAAPMVVASDPAARNGQFIWVPSGATYDCATAVTGASATYTVTIPRSGSYRFWARTISPNTGSDSFCLKIASIAPQTWSLPVRTSWGWSAFKSPVALAPGTYQIQIRVREPRAKLDQLIITDNASYTPQ
jgi:hypothetical protein